MPRVRAIQSADQDKENVGVSKVNQKSPAKAKTTPKKTTPKKAVVNAKTPEKKKTPTKESGKAKKAKSKSQEQESVLFDVVKTAHKNAQLLTSTIDDWVNKYTEDAEGATLDIINFVVASCGAPQRISVEQFKLFDSSDDSEVQKDILKSLGAVEERETGFYPIISKAKDLKKFKSNLLEFWKKLIGQCQREILYDSYFLETLFSWLIEISQSPVRAFRHTANISALHIQSSLVHITSKLGEKLAITQRQLEQEQSKKDKSKSKIKDLKENSNTTQSNIKYMEELLMEVFTEFRDVAIPIRAECVAYLGDWVIEYPVLYSKNNCLRMLGWALSDRAPEVRISAVEALRKVYCEATLASQIDMFTEAFKEISFVKNYYFANNIARMVQMIEDIDIPCAVAAIGLCSQLANNDALADKDIDDIYGLISDTDGRIRYRAAEFIQDYHLEQVVTNSEKAIISAQGKKKKNQQSEEKQIAAAKLLALIDLLLDKSSHRDLPDYLIDALWGRCDVLTSWEVMTDLALHPKEPLTEDEAFMLAKFMNVCAKRALGNQIVPKTKTDPSHRDSQETLEENMVSLTTHFATVLPKLLDKFVEEDIIAELVQIPQYFSLDVYATYGFEEHFKSLLEKLVNLFDKSVSKEIFGHIAKTLGLLKNRTHKLQRDVIVRVSETIERTFQKFKNASKKLKESSDSTSSRSSGHTSDSEDQSNGEYYSLTLNLQRLTAFHLDEDVQKVIGVKNNYFDAIDRLFRIALKTQHDDNEKLLSSLVDASQLCLLWDVSYINVDNTTRAEQQPILKNATTFIAHLHELLVSGTDLLKEKAFYQLSDTLITFNRTYKEYKKTIAGLAYDPSDELIQNIIQYFQSEMTSMGDTSALSANQKDDDDDDAEDSPIERESLVCARKIDFIAALGKLIAFNAFGGHYKDYASEILIHFVDHGKTVAEAIRNFLKLLRASQQVDFDYMFATLKKKYEAIDLATATKETFEPLSKLAARLAGSYGIVSHRQPELRSSLANLISRCIVYVGENVKDHSLLFKYALAPFVSKLDGVAAERLVEDFDEKLKDVISETDENEELSNLRKSLQQVSEKGERTVFAKKAKVVPQESDQAKKVSPTKRKLAEEGEKPNKKKKTSTPEEEQQDEEEKEQEEKEQEEKEQEEKEQVDEEEEEEEAPVKPTKKTRSSKTSPIGASKKQKKAARVGKTVPLAINTQKRKASEESGDDESPTKKQKMSPEKEPVQEITEDEVSVPKRKRGSAIVPSQSSQESQPINQVNEEEPNPPKRKGRKPNNRNSK